MRRLKRSEVVLLALCGVLVAGLGNLFLWRTYKGRVDAAEEAIAKYEGDLAANRAAASEVAFWEQRDAWLDENLPAVEDAGKAQGDLLDYLRDSARRRGLVTDDAALAKPQDGAHYREVAASIEAQGPDESVFRWLAEMQSPESFLVIKSLQIEPERRSERPELECRITLAKWFKK